MKEGILFNANIDKGRFQPVLQVAHFALVNAGDYSLDIVSLDGEILQSIVFHDANSGFERLGVDDDFGAGRLLGQELADKFLYAGNNSTLFLFLSWFRRYSGAIGF